MKNKNCKHEKTKKLFYKIKNTWVRTKYAFCLECGQLTEREEKEYGN